MVCGLIRECSGEASLLLRIGWVIRMRHTFGYCVPLVLLLSCISQGQEQSAVPPSPNTATVSKGIGYIFNYLNMAETKDASQFTPLSQSERTRIYWKTMVNPLGYIKAATSAGIDQWGDKPQEWQQGAAGYGKRFANILGQYSIQRSVTFVLSSGFHEDNRYFNSGKKGVWRRTGYALASGILARHDDGTRHASVSQVAGVAAGAFISRLWQPPSQHSSGDAAVSFGITMASNIGFSVVKEFLPDIGRVIAGKHSKASKGDGPRRSPRCKGEGPSGAN